MVAWQQDHEQTKAGGASQKLKDGAGLDGGKTILPAFRNTNQTKQVYEIKPMTQNGKTKKKAAPKTDRPRKSQRANVAVKPDKAARQMPREDPPAQEPVTKSMGGRPTGFTPELAKEICERVALGETLTAICQDEAMPGVRTAYQWLDAQPIFAKSYALARMTRAESRAHRIDDYVRQAIEGKMHPNVARVAIDAEKWQAARENPKRYGDKVVQEIGFSDEPGDNGQPDKDRLAEIGARFAKGMLDHSPAPRSGDLH